jgi:hypothetical protein
MYWRLYDKNVHVDSDYFAVGNSRCLDGLQIQAEVGDSLSCGVMILAGKQDFRGCDSEQNIFDPRSTISANYICSGTTFTPSCRFDGYTE